jgi:hypothetical protein
LFPRDLFQDIISFFHTRGLISAVLHLLKLNLKPFVLLKVLVNWRSFWLVSWECWWFLAHPWIRRHWPLVPVWPRHRIESSHLERSVDSTDAHFVLFSCRLSIAHILVKLLAVERSLHIVLVSFGKDSLLVFEIVVLIHISLFEVRPVPHLMA